MVPLDSYTPMPMFFLLLVAALEVFSVSVTLFWMFSKVPKLHPLTLRMPVSVVFQKLKQAYGNILYPKLKFFCWHK
jgi:hypothetical protein